mgnify:CR=1 FL=1
MSLSTNSAAGLAQGPKWSRVIPRGNENRTAWGCTRSRAAALLLAALAYVPVIPVSFTAVSEFRPGLEVEGGFDDIEVSPAGEVWFGTSTGRVYRSRNWNDSWEEIPVPIRAEHGSSLDHGIISQMRFFDSQHGLITGYIGELKNLAYRTTDGGKRWEALALPSSFWVYDAQTNSDGTAWLVGSEGEVLFSRDFGASWSRLKPPYDKESRSYRVHFVTPSKGLVASLDGGLKLTETGGNSWRRIKSPLEMDPKSCKGERIETARLFGNTLLVCQCGELFFRPLAGDESWHVLRAGNRPLLAFELWSGGLLAVASDFEIIQIGTDLSSIHPTGSYLSSFPVDIAVGAGKAVFLDAARKVSVLGPEGFQTSWMMKEGTTTPDTDKGSSTKPISDRQAIADYLTHGYPFEQDFHRIYALSQVKRIDALKFLADYEFQVRFYVFPTAPSTLAGHVAISVDHLGAVMKVSEEQGLNSVLGSLALKIKSTEDAVSLARDFLLLTNVHSFYWEGEPGGVNIISSISDIPFDEDPEGSLERIILSRKNEITPPTCEAGHSGFAYRFFSWRPDEGALYDHRMSISPSGAIHHDEKRLSWAYGKYTTGCEFPLDFGPNAEELASLISSGDPETSELVVDYILMIARSNHHLYELRLQNLKEKPALRSTLMTLLAEPGIDFHRKIELAAKALK